MEDTVSFDHPTSFLAHTLGRRIDEYREVLPRCFPQLKIGGTNKGQQ